MLRLAALLLLAAAPRASAGGGETSEDVTVWAEDPVRRARLEIVEALEDHGYTHRRTRKGKDIFIAPEPYRPKVILDRDQATVVTRRRNLVWTGADGRDDNGGLEPEDVWCLLWPPACLSTSGAQISKRKYHNRRRMTLDVIAPQLEAYRRALQESRHEDRIAHQLPAELDRLWREGVAPDGTHHASPRARRDAMVEFWLSRVDDAWGDDAREVIERFLVQHVQRTPYALTDDEIAAIDARRTGERPFTLVRRIPPPPEPVVEEDPAEVAPASPAPDQPSGQAEAPPWLGPLSPDAPARSVLLDVPPLGAPTRRHPLDWLRGTEEDAQDANTRSPTRRPDAPPGMKD